MIFYAVTYILHHLRVYYELTTWSTPQLDNSDDRAPQRYPRGHGVENRPGLKFFKGFISQPLTLCIKQGWSVMYSYNIIMLPMLRWLFSPIRVDVWSPDWGPRHIRYTGRGEGGLLFSFFPNWGNAECWNSGRKKYGNRNPLYMLFIFTIYFLTQRYGYFYFLLLFVSLYILNISCFEMPSLYRLLILD